MTVKQFFYLKPVAIVRRLQLVVALPLYFYAALSSHPAGVPSTLPDWLMHFLGNALLFGSVWLGLCEKVRFRTLLLILIPLALMVELNQHFVPGREVDYVDAAANIVGLAVGFAICRLFARYFLREQAATPY